MTKLETQLRAAVTSRKIAEERLRTLQAQTEAAVAGRRAERAGVQANYDTTNAGSKKRRQASVERATEEGLFDANRHLRAVNISRDLLRNFTAAKTLDGQIRTNVVGEGPGLKLHTDSEDANTAGQNWFNSTWAKNCDSRDDTPWGEVLECLVSALGTDGGAVVAFDDFDEDDGKLLFWSTDQLATVSAEEWKQNAPRWARPKGKLAMQDRGIVRTAKGRVLGYLVASRPGEVEYRWKDVTPLSREVARLWKRPWRLNQIVPIPDYLTMAADLEDLFEMRSATLQTAKRMAKQYAWIESASQEAERGLENGINPEIADDASTDAVATAKTQNYEAVEAYSGGFTDYMDPGDKVNLADPTQPSDKVAPFFDHCLLGAGGSVGCSRAYTTMKAETSYTAFRGELLMSWRTFRKLQKSLERRVCDWIAIKALGWAQAKGIIAELPAGWEAKVAWDWPRMPIIDESQTYNAYQAGLKTGAIDWSDITGPNWKAKMTELAAQVAYAKSLGLPLSIFETVAGAPATKDEPEKTQETQPDEEQK